MMKGLIMMAKIAIYARKSVVREDSISIESQIEMCIYEARGEDYVVYQDNGFSGKDTDRPDFKRMLKDIQQRLINKVIVYKLDRISRSVLDFSEMIQMFQRYNVNFISATEHFDTSSPMGRAMLNICIVFAQLERETIQQRIADAYASRSKRGFYMGGKIPYGYCKIPTTIDGISTSMYQPIPEEADDIRLIFDLYSNPSSTLGDVMRELVARGLSPNRRGQNWSTARLSELMRNPAYTSNSPVVYQFFKEQSSEVVNAVEQYDDSHSLYLFSGENTNRKTWDLKGQKVVIAPHTGIIDPETWVACRKKLLSNHQVRSCKPKNSFLAGKVKCGYCGYAITVRYRSHNGHANKIKYFIDSGRDIHACTERLPTIRVDEFETMILEKIGEKIDSLSIRSRSSEINSQEKAISELTCKIRDIESKIDKLLDALTEEDGISSTKKYIDAKISRLDNEKRSLSMEIDRIRFNMQNNTCPDTHELKNIMAHWDDLSFEDKRNVVEILIHKITVYKDVVEINWKV